MGRVALYPSILSADFSRLAEEIALVEKAGVDGLHLDVMDGHFVPNISFGPVVVRSIRKVTKLPFWAHLMIEEPNKYLEAFRDGGVEGIIVHAEIEDDLTFLAERIHTLGIQAGVALNPETDVGRIEGVLDRFDRILVMTVHPGFGGQSFLPEPLEKIVDLKHRSASWSQSVVVAVDGGIDGKNVFSVVEAGADVVVVGSAIFGADDPVAALRSIRNKAGKSSHT